MEEKYRKCIKDNLEKLIKLTDYEILMQGCVDNGLLTQVMRNIVYDIPADLCDQMSDEEKRNERHRRLFIKLTKRGPDAYCTLKRLLSQFKWDAAVKVLHEPDNDDSQFQSIHPRSSDEDKFARLPLVTVYEERRDVDNDNLKTQNGDEQLKLTEHTKPIQPKKKYHVIKSKQLHDDPKLACYPMKSRDNRGVLFMVNIIEFPNKEDYRNGAEADSESLLYLFKKLGFKLFSYKNLNFSEFFKLLNEMIKSEYTRNAECFVLVLMTHGVTNENSVDHFQLHDGSFSKVNLIEQLFSNTNCPNLAHKPKILIFPFCRGNKPDRGIELDFRHHAQADGVGNSTAVAANIPTSSDIIICNATESGFNSFRDPLNGSWYVQKFCEIMAAHAHDTNFEDIVKMIQRETGKLRSDDGALQMGSFTNKGFNKQLLFNPGVYEESQRS